jgi:hypothetical protein
MFVNIIIHVIDHQQGVGNIHSGNSNLQVDRRFPGYLLNKVDSGQVMPGARRLQNDEQPSFGLHSNLCIDWFVQLLPAEATEHDTSHLARKTWEF